MHLSSAKLICPYFLSFSLEFLISNINFEKAILGLFFIDSLCHKIVSPNLKESSGLLEDWWSFCLSYFFSCFNSWKATSIYCG